MQHLRLLRRRPVLVLWLAQSLSVLGDRLYVLAVMWVVYAATDSASLMGLVAGAESLPYVTLGTVGRRLVSRFSSYRALAWVDGARAAVAVALPFLWSPDARGIALLLAGVLLLGTLGALFDPNLAALVPDLVEADQVQQINGLLDLTGRIARIAGSADISLLLLFVSEVQLFTLNGATSLCPPWRCAGRPAGTRPTRPDGWLANPLTTDPVTAERQAYVILARHHAGEPGSVRCLTARYRTGVFAYELLADTTSCRTSTAPATSHEPCWPATSVIDGRWWPAAE
ncbi:MFS transporter [Streptomyces sp. NPDC059564]|uniref:MFS transporter n=1 Tax=Streptomyces sp. NPDC059564 TaxID=3346865 RepID=UPI0036C7456F